MAAEHPNIYYKVSGLVESAQGKPAPDDVGYHTPTLDALWEIFGEYRLVYGSNWFSQETAKGVREMTRSRFFCTFLLISLTLVGRCLAEFDAENCVGMWLFDDASGDIAKDSSGNGNDGILMSDPKWVKGKIGSALELDGQDDWINMGDE